MQKYLVLGIVMVAMACNGTVGVDGANCVPPNNIDLKDCCPVPHPNKEDNKCFEEFKQQTQRNMEAFDAGGPMRGCCISECMMNSTGVAVDGNIDAGALKRILKEGKGDVAEWDEVLDKAVDKCVAEAATKTEEFEKSMSLPKLNPDDRICNPKYGYVKMCIMKESFQNCPEKVFQKDKPECEAMKTYLNECPLPKKPNKE